MITSWKLRSSQIRIRRPFEARGKRALRVEELESRTLLSNYGVGSMRGAYGFNQLSYTGSGQTIAIVDAYDDPNISSDLAQFDAEFGLPAPPSFQKAFPQGQPAANSGWASEIALDVEWAHAIAPGANILLVEAADSSFTNLLSAVDYAANNAEVVSMSWGGSEFSGETSYDYHFSHAGVTFVAASGDNGGSPEWPATSSNVLAVGGTSLTANITNLAYISETGWGGSGGGASNYELKPSYQSTETLTMHHKGTPDVAYDADPNTGAWIYDSFGSGGWAVYGGTSLGAPSWAALIALADQGRGGNALTGNTQVLPALYQLYASSNYLTDFHDVVSGSNGYSAGTGYDFVTGLGSPKANTLVPYLVGFSGSVAVTGTGTTGTGLPSLPSSPARPGAQLLTTPAGAALLQAASSGTISGPSVSSTNQPASGTVLPIRSPAPLLAGSARLSESRVESGGGDNAALWSDEDSNQDPDWIAPMPSEDAIPNPAPVTPATSAEEALLVPILGPARDGHFANECEAVSLGGATPTSSPLLSEDSTWGFDPATGATLLAAMLGYYWSAPSKEAERRDGSLPAA